MAQRQGKSAYFPHSLRYNSVNGAVSFWGTLCSFGVVTKQVQFKFGGNMAASVTTMFGESPIRVLDGGNDYVPLSIMESNARQQFVHLHLWTAGLVTITGPGKKTLQSHYNNDSNSGQGRCMLHGPTLPLRAPVAFPFPNDCFSFPFLFRTTSPEFECFNAFLLQSPTQTTFLLMVCFLSSGQQHQSQT